MHVALSIETTRREEFIDITAAVARVLAENAPAKGDGVVTVFVPHTSAGVTVNENADADVQADMLAWLARAAPQDPRFRHAEGNSDAHIKATLVGASVQVPFVDSRLLLGRWQAIYFCEFDGPHRRDVIVSVAM
jgi:secondary thiamine-phosphate synthase enzyme